MTGGTIQLSLARQVQVLAWRNIRRTARQPASYVPAFIFPLLMMSINASGLADATRIPGFPADSYLDFALAMTFMQGALFATTTAGLSLGEDIEGGFLDRLALTPMRGAALVLGQLAGAIVVAIAASCWYLLVGVTFGVRLEAGWGGVPVLLVLAFATALAFSAIGAFMALRAGSGEAVQGLFPVLFATLFLSSATMPRDLIEKDWFRTITTWNPVSYMVEGVRSLIITGWDAEALLRDAAVLTGVIALGLYGCSRALRTRLART